MGRQLLRSLVAQGRSSDIYLTTLGSTVDFYEPEGFLEVPSNQIPRCVRRLSASHPDLKSAHA